MARDGSALVSYAQPDVYGRHFLCSKRTAAHLDRTKKRLARLAKKHKKAYRLRIFQGCFHTGVDASAGTHDYDACLDVQIEGMDWAQAQRWLRSQGWAAFWRKPPLFGNHIHMISLPPYKLRFVARVGSLIPSQINDYYAHRDGLASHSPDPTWHPKNIKRTIFSYRRFLLCNPTWLRKHR